MGFHVFFTLLTFLGSPRISFSLVQLVEQIIVNELLHRQSVGRLYGVVTRVVEKSSHLENKPECSLGSDRLERLLPLSEGAV